jgi:serine protease Do
MTSTLPDLPGPGSLTDAAGLLAERINHSLVAVRTPQGGGSGTIWRSDGLIVTNHHVVPGDRAEVLTWDDRSFTGRVAARDPSRDLALLRVEASGLEPLEPGDAANLKPGNVVFAIGNPWGIRGSVTAGIVLSRAAATLENGVPVPRAIRADLRLAPGNSGGPMVDSAGRVVGINSMIVGGMAIAVPVETVRSFLEAALDGQPGFLGIHLQPVDIPQAVAASYHLPESGALMLTEVEPGSPADAAGLLPGDLLIGLDGESWGMDGVARRLKSMRAGKAVKLALLRAGSVLETQATPAVKT